MGTWNTKPFGNDKASDWLWKLEEAKDDSVLKAAFEADADADETVAAAAVIEAARREPIGKLPPKAKAWVSEGGFVPSDELVKQAIVVVEKIKTKSELRELWEESNSFKSWLKQMDSLLTGLREAQSLPPLTRIPKSPTPRRLDKIIEKIKPDEESPLRNKLREKLEELTDLEASITGKVVSKTPLTLLAQQGLLPEAKRLVERGAKINPIHQGLTSQTPLKMACVHGRAEMVDWLLEQGAEMQPANVYLAIQSGSIATIQVLVKHGLQLDQFDQKWTHYETLLHKAVAANHPHVIEFLFKSGMSLEVQDSLEGTALKKAANQTNESINNDTKKVIEMLLSLGANPNAKSKHGFTALDLVSKSRPDISELIKKHGGRLGEEIPD